jgi:putative membrane protein
MSRTVDTFVLAAMSLGSSAGAFAQAPQSYGPMHGEWMWTMMGGGFMWMMPLLFIVAIVALVTLVVRLMSPRHATEPRTASSAAIALLDARYARGEIGREEYVEKKKDLAAA